MSNLDKIKELHATFGHPHPDRIDPREWTHKLRRLRLNLILEEACELAQAYGFQLNYQLIPVREAVDVLGAADASGDLEVVVLGNYVAMGLPAQEIFDEIHRSNMSKLGADGKPLLREDGKFLKGPFYSPPKLTPILMRHYRHLDKGE